MNTPETNTPAPEAPQHTPGPWHWNAHPLAKTIRLIARNGDYVLFTRRWGNGSTLYFQKRPSGIMEKAQVFFKDFPNRHHHREWAQTIDHPDAHLIAAAPDLLEAAKATEQCIVDFLEIYKNGGSMLVMDEAVKSLRNDALKQARAAIAKAGGNEK